MPNSPGDTEDVAQPSVYVDSKILIPSINPSILKSCKDQDSKDQELIDAERGKAEFVEFEVYEVEKKMEEVDVYCSTPEESGSECGDDNKAILKITLQPMANGFIVNNSCYLTWQQWHTVISPNITDRLLYCIVCAAYIETDSGEAHVSTANHRAALHSFPPLEKLDLSITRKIRNQYHCGVCNEVFNIKDENDHFSGKMHEGNLLFSINRASDLLDNYGYPKSIENKTETYHFKTHKMRNDSASGCESISSDFGKDNLDFINWQNNYQHEDDDEFEFEQPAFTGLSYATMAKKPKAKTQTYLDIDLGNKKVKVRFDSWHMVISPAPNRFWCMVCKQLDIIRNKQAHCQQSTHLHNLNACKVVQQYTEYFIRQVDDKLYHCGHCNNLQMIHEMDDHIETNHPKKGLNKAAEAKNINAPVKNNENNKNGINTMKNNNIPKSQMKNINTPNSPKKNNNSPMKINVKKDYLNNNNIVKPVLSSTKTVKKELPVAINNGISHEINKKETVPVTISHKMPDIYDDMVIFPFGYKITIPSLSYNIVCKRPNDFYCGLCDLICEESAICGHVYEVRHLELLHRTPFIAPYSCNLIRAIRDMLHCAICNIPITAAEIYNHMQNPQHIDLLSKALGQNIGAKIPTVPDIPTNLQVPTNVRATIPKPESNLQANPNIGVNNISNDTNFLVIPVTNVPNAIKNANKNNIGATPNISTEVKKNIEVKHAEIIKEEENEEIMEEYDEEEDFDEEYNENDNTFDSLASEDATFDFEEYVYLKLRNTYIKISNTSYNTLVHVGDGSRYCFVCSERVQRYELQKHVDSRSHLENMEKYRFLDKYEDHLLRQIYLMYHCAICNVIITRKELKLHLEWPTHALQNENTLKNIKKTRKNDIKGGIKQIIVSTQKENIYLHEKEPNIKISFNANVVQSLDAEENKNEEFSRKNKIVIFNDNVLKLPWEHWQGISKIKNGYKCNLCQRDLKSADIDVHCTSEWHKYSLDKPFEKQYAPALVRKINETTLNCVICNTEVSNKPSLIAEHINGKRHARAHDAILKDSSQARTYTDCHNDVLML